MDNLDQAARSSLMGRVKGKNTNPELAVRSVAHRAGYRFRLHDAKLPGKPDLVFASRRKVIFVHGCFWHRHEGCKKATTPKTRTDFWQGKFTRNVSRDAKSIAILSDMGWETLVVWECETKDQLLLMSKIASFLDPKTEC